MHPTLFRIGGFQITTYGLMLAIAFAVAASLIVRRGEREGIPGEFLQNLLVVTMVAALLGARLLHILVNFDYFLEHPAGALFSREGYVFFGGLLAGIAASIYWIRRQGQDVWKVADVIAPYLSLAQGIGRWGCFGFGCCYGRPSSLPWAVRFPRTIDPFSGLIDGAPAYLDHLSKGWIAPDDIYSLPVHPSQLYESALAWLNFLILLYLRKRGCQKGDLFLIYLLLYSIGRFLVEFTRGDPRGEILHLLSTSQVVSMGVFAVAGAFLIHRRLSRIRA
ncbi:MAG TPA: prolipoprotein diacylglyceryl transferase [bacterium]|nr:prolipoprotein diacylglyceryl transferase [bacterium]HQL61473.1 prolipoprotein diacylglyceryl transferase [bacterium]